MVVSAGELFEVGNCVQKSDKDTGEMYYSLTLSNKNGDFYAKSNKPFVVGSLVSVSGKLKINKGYLNINDSVITQMVVSAEEV